MPGWVHTEFHARDGAATQLSIPDWLWIDAGRRGARRLRDAERGRVDLHTDCALPRPLMACPPSAARDGSADLAQNLVEPTRLDRSDTSPSAASSGTDAPTTRTVRTEDS